MKLVLGSPRAPWPIAEERRIGASPVCRLAWQPACRHVLAYPQVRPSIFRLQKACR
jgi:hypothetical protein